MPKKLCLYKDTRAVAMIEFALVLPILILLLAGVFETSRYVMAAQKVDKTAGRMGDIITRFEDPDAATRTQILATAPQFLGSYYSQGPYEVIMTGILRETNDPAEVVFQDRTGANLGGSEVSPGGAGINIPGFNVEVGDSIIVTEVRYDYEGLADIIFGEGFFSSLGFDIDLPDEFYAMAVQRTRITNLEPPDDRDACGFPPQAPNNPGGRLPSKITPNAQAVYRGDCGIVKGLNFCEFLVTLDPVPAFPIASGCP